MRYNNRRVSIELESMDGIKEIVTSPSTSIVYVVTYTIFLPNDFKVLREDNPLVSVKVLTNGKEGELLNSERLKIISYNNCIIGDFDINIPLNKVSITCPKEVEGLEYDNRDKELFDIVLI